MELENIVCAFVNMKSKELHIKFKDTYLLNKRKKLIVFLKQEFGDFNINYCSNTFTNCGFIKPYHIFLCVLISSIINGLIYSYAFNLNIFLSFIIIFFILFWCMIYAKS